MTPLRFGSLFAGIGGMDLGLERAGMQCVWQVEIDEFCRKVLIKHWPNVPKYNDVRECGKHNLESVDLIAGGFPCQDISNAGKREGIDGARSGLWSEFHRIICELRPRYVLVENVAALLVRGVSRVLGDLAASGYDAEWRVLRASDVAAPHRRERLFILAYPEQDGRRSITSPSKAETAQLEGWPFRILRGWSQGAIQFGHGGSRVYPERAAWPAESSVARMANGLPDQLDRIASIGNAVVPQIAEWIGQRIIEADRR